LQGFHKTETQKKKYTHVKTLPLVRRIHRRKNSTEINEVIRFEGGPGSSVGMATDYGLDGPGSSAGGDEILRPSRPALGPTSLL
jgi:hypothetical protein